MTQFGFFDLLGHLQRLSEAGDQLEEMARLIDFEAFRPLLTDALQRTAISTELLSQALISTL